MSGATVPLRTRPVRACVPPRSTPATERIRCAGRMAMKNVVAVAAVKSRVVSQQIRPENAVATAPNPAGMKTHTSFRLTGVNRLITV